MSSLTKLLTPMKRSGEVLSIKSLNAQINTMMQAIHLIEDQGSRFQFTKRIEVVQRDLHRLRSELEGKMPRNLKRPSTLNIDHSRLLIGSPEEGYMPLTKTVWQNVQDMTQRIDRLSEGLTLVVQRHCDKGRHLKASRSEMDRYSTSGSDYSGASDVRDNIQQTSYYSRGTDESLDSGSTYSFASSQSTSNGNQALTPSSHSNQYYHPSSNAQPNQFTPSPNYLNPQLNHYNRFSTSSSSSSTIQGFSRNRSHGFTEYPSLSYFPGIPLYQTPVIPGPNPSLRRIPADMSHVGNFNNGSLINHLGQKSSEYPPKMGARHTHRSRN